MTSTLGRAWSRSHRVIVLFTISACGLGDLDNLSDKGAAGASTSSAGTSDGFAGVSAGAGLGGAANIAGESSAGGLATAGGGSAGNAASGAGQSGGSSAVCTGKPPAIFWVPHQDDDYLAMALGIAEHVAAGRHVKVVLYTNGGNTGLRHIMNGKDDSGTPIACPLYKYKNVVTGLPEGPYEDHPEFHAFNMTDQDIKDIRTQEFMRSMQALGVTDMETTNWEDTAVTGYASDPFTQKLKALILEKEQACPNTSHKCVSGPRDCRVDGRAPFPTHYACWNALAELMRDYPNGLTGTPLDVRAYDDYIYFHSDPSKWVRDYDFDLKQYMPQKAAAFHAYYDWAPAQQRFALGYHSVPMLFDRARNDTRAHLEAPGNTPPTFLCPAETPQ